MKRIRTSALLQHGYCSLFRLPRRVWVWCHGPGAMHTRVSEKSDACMLSVQMFSEDGGNRYQRKVGMYLPKVYGL